MAVYSLGSCGSDVIGSLFGHCSRFETEGDNCGEWRLVVNKRPSEANRREDAIAALVQHPSSEDARRRWEQQRESGDVFRSRETASPNSEAVSFRTGFFSTARREPERTSACGG